MSKTSVLVTVTVIMGKVSGLLPMSAESLSGECPHHCPPYYSPVCGTDNRDYDNVCKMLQSACLTDSDVTLAHVGRCGVPEPCPSFCPTRGELSFCGDDGVTYPSMCHVMSAACRGQGPGLVSEGRCKGELETETGWRAVPDNTLETLAEQFRYFGCSKRCPLIYQHVCGTDGRTHNSRCQMEVTACLTGSQIQVAYEGRCRGQGGEFILPPDTAAVEAEEEEDCPDTCGFNYAPVCGTDGKTYSNECALQQRSCDSPKSIKVAYKGSCGTVEIRSEQDCEFCQRIFRPVCGSDGVTYSNECELRSESCRRGDTQETRPEVKHSGSCNPVDTVTRLEEAECDGIKPCSKIFSPVCASSAASNMTFSNECQLRQEVCTKREVLKKIHDGVCDDSHHDAVDSNVVTSQRSGSCPYICDQADSGNSEEEEEEVCGSDGRTYVSLCQLQHQTCASGSNLQMIHEGRCDEMKSVAEHATQELGPALSSDYHLTLSYTEAEEKQQTRSSDGYRYILTVNVGRSACPITKEYSKADCPIVAQDSNLRCDVTVDGESHHLVSHECEKAFDFQSVCVGCPVEGTEEAEAARTVAQYVVVDLTNKAAHAHVIRNHLGLQNIKKFMSESDGEGGVLYDVEVTVGETNCSLATDFVPERCFVNKRETRRCSAQVHETVPGDKMPRGVDIKRYEVKSTLCKDSHDTVNLERQASPDDQDVVDVAKELTHQVGESFSSKMWLVTQIVSANRVKVEEGINYALTLRFSETNCPLSVVKDSDTDLLYSGACTVEHTAESRYCQLLVNKQRLTYRSITNSAFRLTVLDQICAEKKECPSGCDKVSVSPVCGSDGRVYPNSCYLQAASCRRRSDSDQLRPAPDSLCARSQLQDNVICAGCPVEGSQENEDVRAAADFANIALTQHFNSSHYFALDSITNVRTQVVAGTNYFLTILVGESDCEVGDVNNAAEEFNKVNCTINLEHDNNHQCDVVVYKPIVKYPTSLQLTHKKCNKVAVSQHVLEKCNLKCKKTFQPVCGTNGKTYLNECLLNMSACINGYQVEKLSDGQCELDEKRVEMEARFAATLLTRKFKDDQRWQIQEIVSGKKVPSGVKLQLKVRETECFKADVTRSERDCSGAEEDAESRPVRNCEVTVAQTRNILNVKESQCVADVVTRCDECYEDAEDTLEIAKFAVERITKNFDSNKWALQHIAKAQTKVVKDKYIVYNLSLHMSETSCPASVTQVYSGNCWVNTRAPTNYCDITVLQSLKSDARKISRKTCAGYNVAKYF